MGGRLMKRFDLVIPLGLSDRRYRVVEAYETRTPGLFVNRDIGNRYQWAVTHWSGTLVGAYEWETREEAIAFATELADVLEWHRPVERLREEWSDSTREALELARMRVVHARSRDKAAKPAPRPTRGRIAASGRSHSLRSEAACG